VNTPKVKIVSLHKTVFSIFFKITSLRCTVTKISLFYLDNSFAFGGHIDDVIIFFLLLDFWGLLVCPSGHFPEHFHQFLFLIEIFPFLAPKTLNLPELSVKNSFQCFTAKFTDNFRSRFL